MRIQRIGIIIGMLSGLFLGAVVLAMSLSPTTISIPKPVHFFTPDGTDIIINPGNYEIEAAGNTLRLQSPDTKEPIHILAGPAPFPEDVDSPVAMAIPIPDEGIYLALVAPQKVGMEAMGSYSGIHTRSRSLLQIRRTLTAQRRSQLSAFARQLRKSPQAPKLKQQWKQLIQPKTTKGHGASPANGSAAMVQVLRQAYLETTKDLQSMAAKIAANNQKKKELREQMKKLREKKAQATSAKDNETQEKMKEKFDQALKDLEAEDKLGNFEIQRLMSQYNQAEQAASSILKKKQDAESSVIRKIN